MAETLRPGPGEAFENTPVNSPDKGSVIQTDGIILKTPDQLDADIEIMCASGLEDDEILRLVRFKHRVDAGQADDLTIEYKRFMFLKHLYTAGIVSG